MYKDAILCLIALHFFTFTIQKHSSATTYTRTQFINMHHTQYQGCCTRRTHQCCECFLRSALYILSTISTGDLLQVSRALYTSGSFLHCCRLLGPRFVTFCLQTIYISFLHFFKLNPQLLLLTKHILLLQCSLLPLLLFLRLFGSLLPLLLLHVPKEAQVLLRVCDFGQRQLENLLGFRGEVKECEGGETERPGAGGQAELKVGRR